MSSDRQRPIKSELAYYDFDQGSEEWLNLRQKFITASSIGQIINSYGKKNISYRQLVAEKASHGEYRSFFGNHATRWGTKYEPVANMLYEFRNPGVIIYDYGLISNPKYPELAVSPDGITNFGEMLEIKCPFSRKIDGKIKAEYANQIQQQLLVCEYEVCNFLECKFLEFTEHEFWSLHLTNPSDKGIIIQSEEPIPETEIDDSKLTKKKFNYYSPIEISNQPELLRLWYQYRLEDINQLGGEVVKTSFWLLDLYLCQKVQRDPNWYPTNHSAIKQFWNDVNEAKANGWKQLVNTNNSPMSCHASRCYLSDNSDTLDMSKPPTSVKSVPKNKCFLDEVTTFTPPGKSKTLATNVKTKVSVVAPKATCFLDDATIFTPPVKSKTLATNSNAITNVSVVASKVTCLLD